MNPYRWWCVTHACPDGQCGIIGEHVVILLDHPGPPSDEDLEKAEA